MTRGAADDGDRLDREHRQGFAVLRRPAPDLRKKIVKRRNFPRV